MSIEEVQQRIKHIQEISSDDESAHMEQAKLFEDFIRHCANIATWNIDDVPILATEVLKVCDIKFERWFA